MKKTEPEVIRPQKIEVDFESDDWEFHLFAASLNEILSSLENKKNPALLLMNLLFATDTLLENLAHHYPAMKQLDLHKLHSVLSAALLEKTVGNRLDTFTKSHAIGEFVETLIYFGMPRIAAINATAKWLELGVSTVRTHNEKYRKSRLKIHGDFLVNLRLGTNFSEVRIWLKNYSIFPLEHPRAETAFRKAKSVYESKSIIEEINEKVDLGVGNLNLPTQSESA